MRDKSGSNAALSDNNGEGTNNGGDNENVLIDGGIAEDTEVEVEPETDVENGVHIRSGDGKQGGVELKVKEQETKSERGLYLQTETEDHLKDQGEAEEDRQGQGEGQGGRQTEGRAQGEQEVVSQSEREIRYQQGLLANLPNGLTNIPYMDFESGSGSTPGVGAGDAMGSVLGYGISPDYHDPDPIIDLYNKQQRLLMQCQSSRSQTAPVNDYIPSKAKADNAISGISSSSSSSSNTSTSSCIEFYADQYAASDEYSVLELNSPPSLYPTRCNLPPPIKTKTNPTHNATNGSSNGQNWNPGPRSVSQIQMDSPRNKVSVWGKNKAPHSPVMGSWVNGGPVMGDREKDKKRDSESYERDREKSDKEREAHSSNGYTNGNGTSNGVSNGTTNGNTDGKKTLNGIYKTDDDSTDHYTLLFPKPVMSPPHLRPVPGGYRSSPDRGVKTSDPPPRNPFLPPSPTVLSSFAGVPAIEYKIVDKEEGNDALKNIPQS